MTTAAAGALACAGVMAAAPASAADMLSVGLGGYMQQWIGVSDLDSAAGNGGVSQYSDSEFYVRGKLEADNGLTFSVKFTMAIHRNLHSGKSVMGIRGSVNYRKSATYRRIAPRRIWFRRGCRGAVPGGGIPAVGLRLARRG